MNQLILLRCMARLLIALARLALEHDRGYGSRSVTNAAQDAINEIDAELAR